MPEDPEPPGAQAPDEMWSIAQRWNAALNGQVERLSDRQPKAAASATTGNPDG